MIEWIKNNKAGLGLAAACIGVVVLFSSLAGGCSASDLIKVKVPSGVQRSIATPPSITLTDAGHEWDRWVQFVEIESDKFSGSISRGQELLGFVQAMANTGLGAAEAALGGVPFGGFAVGGLGLLAGLFFEKPGTRNKEAKEKESSYNAGMEQGKRIAEEIVRELRA